MYPTLIQFEHRGQTVPQNLPKSPERLVSASCFTETSFDVA